MVGDESDATALAGYVQSAFIAAYRANRGLYVTFLTTSGRRLPALAEATFQVPRGQIWSSDGMKIYAPQAWTDEAATPANGAA